jgi:hypothetical protein
MPLPQVGVGLVFISIFPSQPDSTRLSNWSPMTFALWCVVVLPFASPQDTVALAEVAVHAAALDRFAAGQTLLTYEKSTLERYSARSLGDLLQETSPIFVRQYGAGMVASPSFRGTSPGHTALFWNGVPINSISLGQSDLSILPVQATDRVEVQFGSAGALFGNEAIGGSVHLSTAPTKKEGLQGAFSQTVGSFGLNQTSLTAAYGNPTLRFQTKGYLPVPRHFPSRSTLGAPNPCWLQAEGVAPRYLVAGISSCTSQSLFLVESSPTGDSTVDRKQYAGQASRRKFPSSARLSVPKEVFGMETQRSLDGGSTAI